MRKSQLKREAEGIIAELNLLKLLTAYGDARVVGSVALDLIVKLDIDIHILVRNEDLLEVINDIYRKLLNHDSVHEVRISDYRDQGVKLGIDSYPGVSGNWSIDIWVTNKVEETGFEMVERLRGEMSMEHRKNIMAIKSYYHERGLLRDGISSLIYSAVVEKGVQNVNEFMKNLDENG